MESIAQPYSCRLFRQQLSTAACRDSGKPSPCQLKVPDTTEVTIGLQTFEGVLRTPFQLYSFPKFSRA